ncbi:MAG: cyclopropane-fatty-acyl-phospholipid synthase [Proteobacteria bacterium]|nr:cyclopropane-fatty-acyl-phospholipid synthase [Pseudomonadota bacterium]
MPPSSATQPVLISPETEVLHASDSTSPLSPRTTRGLSGLRSRLVLSVLNRLRIGRLQLELPDGSSQLILGKDDAQSQRADLKIHRWRALSDAGFRGDIGFGEGYMRGDWSSSDLPALLSLLVANRKVIEPALYGSPIRLLWDRLQHQLRSNSRRQSRRNIEFHYDLGNDFYKRWLDPSMTYSSALFDRTGQWGASVDLQAGQLRKLDRVIDCLNEASTMTGPEPKVLEIGCGWGGFAERLLQKRAAHYTGLTLSPAQKAWAEDRMRQNGFDSKGKGWQFLLQDYRDAQDEFDAIVSIEMIEAVGQSYWPTYFQTLHDRLRPGGRAVIQAIVIKDSLFARYARSPDFIQKYIFPGGMLLTPSAIQTQAERVGLKSGEPFGFGLDYARTLREWLERFNNEEPAIRDLGFDDRFFAMWRFYLAYCEAGFVAGDIDVVQVCLDKPRL